MYMDNGGRRETFSVNVDRLTSKNLIKTNNPTIMFICDDSLSSNMLFPSFHDRYPNAFIEKSITTFNSNAPPVMARFSRTSPNPITANLLKVTNSDVLPHDHLLQQTHDFLRSSNRMRRSSMDSLTSST